MKTLKEGTLILNIDPTTEHYLQVGRVTGVKHIPNDGYIDYILVSYAKSALNKKYKGTTITETFIKLNVDTIQE